MEYSSIHHVLQQDVKILRVQPDTYLLYNPITGHSISVDPQERYLIALLQHTSSLSEILEGFRVRFGYSIDESELNRFVRNLWQEGFLDSSPEDGPCTATTSRAESSSADASCTANASERINFGFDVLALVFGWIFSPVCGIGIVLLAAAAGKIAFEHGDRMMEDFSQFASPFPLTLYLLLISLPKLLLLNALHVILYGMACRNFRGRIADFGVRRFCGVLPVFHIEFRDSIQLLGRRGRHTLFLIGLCLPLALGSSAVIMWEATSHTSSTASMSLVFVPASLLRLLIQCNIFYRWGSLYFGMCCLFKEPRLYEAARNEVKAWFRGTQSISPRNPSRRRRLRVYGVLYYAYRTLLGTILLAGGWSWMRHPSEVLGITILIAVLLWILGSPAIAGTREENDLA